jgi:hypothetical protein
MLPLSPLELRVNLSADELISVHQRYGFASSYSVFTKLWGFFTGALTVVSYTHWSEQFADYLLF